MRKSSFGFVAHRQVGEFNHVCRHEPGRESVGHVSVPDEADAHRVRSIVASAKSVECARAVARVTPSRHDAIAGMRNREQRVTGAQQASGGVLQA